MAKKIITEEAPKTDEQAVTVNPANEVETPVTEPEGVATEEEQPEPQTEQKAEEADKSEETPAPHILELLKKFPGYESLYIDAHGGTFAPTTPAAIRGKAVLYKNPYFNELKKNA